MSDASGPAKSPPESLQQDRQRQIGHWVDRIKESADKLARTGADFLICPDNTIHRVMDYVAPRSPLPWLHIAEVVAGEAAARGFGKVGLTGTRWLVESEVYPDKLQAYGIEHLRPGPEDRAEISRIIMEELVYGFFKPEGVAYFQGVIERLRDAGCDAVILGCTEIGLLVRPDDSAIPVFDTARIHALAGVRLALGA